MARLGHKRRPSGHGAAGFVPWRTREGWMGFHGRTFWLYHSRITRKKRPFPGYLPILPILSPSRVPYHATISLDPITTHTRKSREPEIFFSSPLVTANCFVCASLSEIIIPPGPRPRLDETPVVHAVFRFSLLDKDVEKHLTYLGVPWINVDHKDVRMGESGESGQH